MQSSLEVQRLSGSSSASVQLQLHTLCCHCVLNLNISTSASVFTSAPKRWFSLTTVFFHFIAPSPISSFRPLYVHLCVCIYVHSEDAEENSGHSGVGKERDVILSFSAQLSFWVINCWRGSFDHLQPNMAVRVGNSNWVLIDCTVKNLKVGAFSKSSPFQCHLTCREVPTIFLHLRNKINKLEWKINCSSKTF